MSEPRASTPTTDATERAQARFARQRLSFWRLFGAFALIVLADAWAVSAELIPRTVAFVIVGTITLAGALAAEIIPACPNCGYRFGRVTIRHSCPNCGVRLIP
jgi:hypothetical protein